MGAVVTDQKKGVCQVGKEHFPMIGLGTYRLLGSVCARIIQEAAEIGYRIIDTATFYHNFDGIAAALKKLDRRQLYIVSKVWHDAQAPEDLGRDLEATLKQMKTDALDAYFLHWPNSKIPIESTLAAMQKWQKAGKIRHIGLSNVSVNHLKRALEVGIPIDWVQIEMHPFFCDGPLLAFCKQHQIAIQAWRPLDVGRVSGDELLVNMGAKHGKTAGQIALRWIVQHGCVPLPSSTKKNHLAENFAALQFSLSQEEMQRIDQRALSGSRYRMTLERGLGFTDEFDFSYEECWPKSV